MSRYSFCSSLWRSKTEVDGIAIDEPIPYVLADPPKPRPKTPPRMSPRGKEIFDKCLPLIDDNATVETLAKLTGYTRREVEHAILEFGEYIRAQAKGGAR